MRQDKHSQWRLGIYIYNEENSYNITKNITVLLSWVGSRRASLCLQAYKRTRDV